MSPRDSRPIAEITALLAVTRGAALRRLSAELADDDRAGVRSALTAALNRDRAHTREQARLKRIYQLEADLRRDGRMVVAGVDEVGRGALAGPLTAAACVLPPSPRIEGLNDSKQLSPARREELAEQIREVAICWTVSHATAGEVDALGLTAALRRVGGRALAGLDPAPDHVIVDGYRQGLHVHETAVIKGDSKVAAVAAASILAKVTRDALMRQMAEVYPDFLFEVNKGYGTPDHLAAISRCGLCAEHRRTFAIGGGTERLF